MDLPPLKTCERNLTNNARWTRAKAPSGLRLRGRDASRHAPALQAAAAGHPEVFDMALRRPAQLATCGKLCDCFSTNFFERQGGPHANRTRLVADRTPAGG